MLTFSSTAINTPGTGYDNIANWPDLTNRPTFSGSTLSWKGPLTGGLSTTNDASRAQTLTNSGSITTSSNGQLIENLNIAGDITISHTNVTVRKCRVVVSHSSTGAINILSGGGGAIIEDCEIDGSGSSAYGIKSRSGATGNMYRRCNIHGSENGIDPGDNDTLKDCYIWDMANSDNASPHYDNVEFDGGTGLIVDHIQCVNTQGQNACINIDNFFTSLTNVIINNNRCIGAHFTIWLDASFGGGSVSNINITNNFLGTGTSGYFAFTAFTPVHTGNVDYLTFVSVD